MPVIATDAPTGGEIKYITPAFPGINGGLRLAMLHEQVTVAASSATTALATPLPPYAEVISAGMVLDGAATLTTATRFGLGTTGSPHALAIGTATIADNTKYGPVPVRGTFPIFASTAASTAYAPSASTEAAFVLGAGPGGTTPSIPANFLKPGDIIRYFVQGITTAVNATDTITIRIKDAANIIAATGAPQVAANDVFVLRVDQVIRTIGATGTYVTGGTTWNGTAAAAAGAADIPSGTFLASTAIDTTAAFTPTLTGQFSTSSATNSCRVDAFVVEVIRPVLPVSSSATTLAVTTLSNAGISTGSATAAAKVNCYVWFWDYASNLPDRAA